MLNKLSGRKEKNDVKCQKGKMKVLTIVYDQVVKKIPHPILNFLNAYNMRKCHLSKSR